MRTPEIEQIAPNFTRFLVDNVWYYFSYNTLVAFYRLGKDKVCLQNYWSTTTGKHLNQIEPDHKKRVDMDTFNNLLGNLTQPEAEYTGIKCPKCKGNDIIMEQPRHALNSEDDPQDTGDYISIISFCIPCSLSFTTIHPLTKETRLFDIEQSDYPY